MKFRVGMGGRGEEERIRNRYGCTIGCGLLVSRLRNNNVCFTINAIFIGIPKSASDSDVDKPGFGYCKV